MITVMRRYRRLLQVGLLVVIAAFVITSVYVGTRQGGAGADSVATVNGEDITTEQYQRRYRLYFDFYSRFNQGRWTPETAERMGLPQLVMDDLIREAVAVQRASVEGLALSDAEFNAEVHAIPDFQEDGRFSMPRYQAFLRARGHRAEEDLRRQMTVRKLQRLVAGGAKVTDAEVDAAVRLRNEEVRAAWALVELAPLVTAATATDDEAQAYLKDRGDEFREPERRKIQYVTIAPKDFRPSVTDADVRKYYDEHAKEFETVRQVHAAHVLVSVGTTGGSEAEDKARAKIADVIKRAKAGEDFAALATAVSEDPGSKPRGGDLGWVAKGEMVPAFEDALFKLKAGEITAEPVRTPFGFHAIKAIAVREAGKKPLKEVAAQIRDTLAADAADAAARQRAEELKPPLQAAQDFMAEARRRALTAVETTLPRATRPPGAPADPFEEAAFALTRGGVSAPVKTPAGYMIIKAFETIPAGVPPFGEVRDRVVAAVKRQKADKAAAEAAGTIAAAARDGDLAAAAKKAGAKTGETTAFSRARPAEALPGDVQLKALQTPAGGVADPVRGPQGYYVVKVIERRAPVTDGAADRERIAREMIQQKQSGAWEAWVAAATASAKIERAAGAPAPRPPALPRG